MPGPPKLPAEVKKQRGTFRPHRDGPEEHKMDKLPVAKLERPKDLCKVAGNLWDRLIPAMVKIDMLREVDVPIATGMCRWFAIWKDLDQRIRDWKPSKEYDAMDNERLIALIQRRASDAWKNFSAAAAKLGLTPADRARIRSADDPDGKNNSDPLSYFGISNN